MADTAHHLEREVLPRVPIRHWIASLPWGLRALLGYDRKLCAEVASAFIEEGGRASIRGGPSPYTSSRKRIELTERWVLWSQ